MEESISLNILFSSNLLIELEIEHNSATLKQNVIHVCSNLLVLSERMTTVE